MTERGRALGELAWLFLRLGTTAFGGPAAHIAMMEDEVVHRRAWMTREEFLDLLGAANLIPGPNSTELAIHIGHRRAGFAGLIVAGACFIIPAFVLVTIFGWLYVQFGHLPRAMSILGGIKPVIIAVVVQALWRLTRTAVKSPWLGALTIAAITATAFGVSELAVLFGGGILAMLVAESKPRVAVMLPPCALLKASGVAAASFGLWPLFVVFAKVGSIIFGSGYVLLAYLRTDLVERLHWLTNGQLIDAIAVGQFTPGPVFTTATFVGYILGGVRGGTVATLGIFLPAFIFVAVSAPFIPRLRRSRAAGGFLDGVNVASLGLMVVVTWILGRAAIVNIWTLVLAVVSAIALIRFRVNSVWLVLAGGVIGAIAGAF